jgi:dGTPase
MLCETAVPVGTANGRRSNGQKGGLSRRVLLAVLKYPVAHSQAANPAIVPRLDESLTSIRTLDLATCKPPKCYFDAEGDVVAWILEKLDDKDKAAFQSASPQEGKHKKPDHKSFDCSIMDLSDDSTGF